MSRRNVRGHKADFDARRFRGRMRWDMAGVEVRRRQFIGGEGQCYFSCLELAVGCGFMEEPNAESER